MNKILCSPPPPPVDPTCDRGGGGGGGGRGEVFRLVHAYILIDCLSPIGNPLLRVPSVANSLSATTNRPIPHHTDADTRLAADPSAQLKMDEVLELDSDVKFVLVEGAPGIGKTFFCSELYRKWATLQSLQEYKIALHLKLRQERVQIAKSLRDILAFFHLDTEFCARVEKEIYDSDGKDVLFILDGFDELPSPLIWDMNSFIMKVIRGQFQKQHV